MVRTRNIFAVFFLTAGLLCTLPERLHAWPTSLNESLKQAAIDIEAKNFPTFDRSQVAGKIIKSLSDTPAGKAKLVAIADVTLLGSPGTSVELPRRIQVSRYEYATGLTWRTTVDVSKGEVVGYTADANRPTPLAPDEIERAIEMASPFLAAIGGDRSAKINTVVMIQSSKSHPLYAHRLVAIWPETRTPTRRALVDLTTQSLVSKDY